MIDNLLTPETVAEILHIKPKRVHALVREGKLGCYQEGRTRLFTEEHIHAFLQSHEIVPPNTVDQSSPSHVPSSPGKGVKQRRDGMITRRTARAQCRKDMREW